MSETQTPEALVIEALADAPIALPDDPAYLTAEYFRDGGDLLIRTADGAETLVSGYFDLETPVDLIVSGAAIAGRVVGALARPEPAPEPKPAEPAAEDGAAATPRAEAATTAAAEPAPAALGEPIGAVGEIHGEAFAKRADGSVVPLAAGDPVYEDDMLSTAADASLGVVFTDGMTFSLGAEARMVLDEFRYDAEAQEGGGLLSVLAGEFSFVSGAAAGTAEDALMIETPTMTIGVRGTKVVSQIGADGETSRIALLAEEDGTIGKILVMTDAGEELITEPNKMVEISSRFEPPSPQKEIESADVLRFFGDALESLPAPKAFFEPNIDAPVRAPAAPFAQERQARAQAQTEALQAELAVQEQDANLDLAERVEEASVTEAEPEAEEAAADFTQVAQRVQELVVDRATEAPVEFVEALTEKLEETGAPEEAAETIAEQIRAATSPSEITLIVREQLAAQLVAQNAEPEPTPEPEPEPEPAPPSNAAPELDAAGGASRTAPEDDVVTLEVAQLIQDGAIADADGAVQAMAVTGLSGDGVWTYSIDGGATYRAFGALSDSEATLLDATARIRFEPTQHSNGDAALTFRAWDQSTGAIGDVGVDVTANGGTSAFSAATASARFDVTPVNDAPVLDGAQAWSAPEVVEDGRVQSFTVRDLLAGGAIADPDGAVEAIAVTGLGEGGVWAFAADGVTYTDFGAVSDNAAVLLDGNAVIRYAPAADFNGQTSLTFRAWDQSAGAHGQKGVDTSVNGGATAFSTASVTAPIAVAPVNDAPTLTDVSPLTVSVTENAVSTSSLGDLLQGSAIADVDGPVDAIAVVGLGGGGVWSYSTDGTTFHPFGAVSEGAAVLLDDAALVRFEPAANATTPSSLTFRAWDKSTGASGDAGVNIAVTGGTSAFSAQTDTVSIAVAAENDAPVLSAEAAPTLQGVVSDGVAPPSQTVGSLIPDGAITDADGAAFEGIAVTGVDTANGLWEYSTDGATFVAVGAVGDASALLLRPTDLLRFKANNDFDGSATFNFRAWDGTSGDAGQKVDATTTGGSSAFSAQAGVASIVVTAPPANNAPTIRTAGAVGFDGNNDFITMDDPGPNTDALDLKTGNMTIEAWFYYDGTGAGDQAIVSKGNEGDAKLGYSIRIVDGELVARVNSEDTGDDRSTAARSIDLIAEGWHHVAMVIDQTAGSVDAYLNGNDAGWKNGHTGSGVANRFFDAPSGGIDADDSFAIGANYEGGGAGEFFSGAIADVRVWDVARSKAEVQSTMATTLDGTETGLVAHWPLDDIVNNSVDDTMSTFDGDVNGGPSLVGATGVWDKTGDMISGRLTAADPDGDAMTMTLTSNGAGETTLDQNTGVWTYTPATEDFGLINFTYQVTDSQGAVAVHNFDVHVV